MHAPPIYHEHDPPPAIAERVECLWTLHSRDPLPAPVLNRVLPDACVDLVFNLGDTPLPQGVPHHAMRAFAVGAMTRALMVHHTGRVAFMGVRFRPGAAKPLLGLPAGELKDTVARLDDLDPRLAVAAEPVLDAASTYAALAALKAMLLERLALAVDTEPLAPLGWARMRACDGAMTVRALATALGIGQRRLQRLFHEHIGLSPKEAARVARLRAALTLIRTHPDLPLGRVALRAGYYDQPHFNHEFVRMAGIAPEAWRAERVASVQGEVRHRS